MYHFMNESWFLVCDCFVGFSDSNCCRRSFPVAGTRFVDRWVAGRLAGHLKTLGAQFKLRAEVTTPDPHLET